jgi:hypothetical protein
MTSRVLASLAPGRSSVEVPLSRERHLQSRKQLLTSLGGSGVGASALSPQDSYLVDSASSHMLVSKIKPCMSKYKQLYCETANGSLNQLSFI